MNYQQALDYLYQFVDVSSTVPRPPPESNVLRTRALLHALGNPHKRFACIVVAGTKGKGSTSAMLEAIARAACLRVGLWSSPHLHSYRERIQINRQLISEAALITLVEQVEPLITAQASSPIGPPSTFALGFGLAMQYFADQQVDLAVVEVGLGGRYDSANVLMPLVSVITSISYDHMELLGDTLGQIAWDKAGILKPGIPAITTAQQPEALAAIAQVASQVGAPLWLSEATATPVAGVDLLNLEAGYHGAQIPGLGGLFQQQNARLAIGTALLLREHGLPIDDHAIATGLATVKWPARFEQVADTPVTIIDGAHNGDSAARLTEALHTQFPGKQIILVFGASRGKDLPRMLGVFATAARLWVLTCSQHPRAIGNLAELREQIAAQPGASPEHILIEPDVVAALDLARSQAGPNDLICITGSLFVAAEARAAYGLAEASDPPAL